MILKEQLDFVKRNSDLINNLIYIEQTKLNLVNIFVNGLKYKIEQDREKQIVIEICNNNKDVVKKFVNKLLVSDISRVLKIDDIKAYAKCYFNSFTNEEIKQIAYIYTGEFLDFAKEEGINI